MIMTYPTLREMDTFIIEAALSEMFIIPFGE